jgi:hypothetical protein
MGDFINLDDLYEPHREREKNRVRIFDVIYSKCVRKINQTNKELNRLDCMYRIPPFILGGPIYNYDEAKKYLQHKLKENGLHTEFIDNETLYISWKPEDINKSKYDRSLRKYKDTHGKKYIEKPIKNKKQIIDANTKIGVLQYDNNVVDLIPINPKALKREKS